MMKLHLASLLLLGYVASIQDPKHLSMQATFSVEENENHELEFTVQD